MHLIREYSQRQEGILIKRMKLFLNKEDPSRKTVFKNSVMPSFRWHLEMCE